MDRNQLLEALTDSVNEEELKTLCFHLGVDYDDLAAQGKINKARELIVFLERHNRLDELEVQLNKRSVPGSPTISAVPNELRPYLGMVARRSRRLPLGPLDPAGRESALISLAQVFINLDATPNAQPVPGSKPNIVAQRLYSSTIAYIQDARQFILLGDPGSGKSTLLRFLAYCFAQAVLNPSEGWLSQLKWTYQRRETDYAEKSGVKRERTVKEVEEHWTADCPIPVLIELRDFARREFNPASPIALWQFVGQRLREDDLETAIVPLQEMAQQGRVIFLLDGVDEVPIARRLSVWQAVTALGNSSYGGNRWVTTCRVLSFDPNEAPPGVPNRTLQPLGEEQINQFIQNWYAALEEAGELSWEQAKTMTERLQNAAHRQRLRALAQNPMLLTIMALVQTYHGTLPDERAKLYQACVETLLLRWQRHKEASDLGELPDVLARLETTQENLERLLWEIAWEAHSRAADREDTADIPEMDVVKIARQHLGSLAKAEQFIEYTERRAHLLVGRGGIKDRVYTFPHRTLQEYLAASHLTPGLRLIKQAPQLAAQGDTWREVLNLAAGVLVFNGNNREMVLLAVDKVLLRQTPELEDEAGWFRVWLAAEMAVVVGRQDTENNEVVQDLLPRLQEQLVALLENSRLTPLQRAEAGDALALLGDPRPGVCALEPDMVPIPAGPFLMGDEKYEVQVDAFAIARYPVTNAQFRYFIQDGGYTDKWRDCWADDGWHYREQEAWTEPRFWQDAFRLIDNKPVVGVSWYEAVAYTNWLTRTTGKGYRLPTEAEWERAARHTDGRQWPWGNEWHDGIVNSEGVIGRTTAVGTFPEGASICGAQDMSGNVWEWCSTRYRDERGYDYPMPYRLDDGREDSSGHIGVLRVLRGSSYLGNASLIRCMSRRRLLPDLRNIDYGFRVAVRLFTSAPSS